MDEERPTLQDVHFSHYNERQSLESRNIYKSMANRTRTKTQIIKQFFSTDSVYHILFIVLLYTGHDIVWSHFGLNVNADPRWHGVYQAINYVLRLEVPNFAVLSLVRYWDATINAVQVDSTWMRKEERDWVCVLSWRLLLSYFLFSITFILVAYYGQHDDSHTIF